MRSLVSEINAAIVTTLGVVSILFALFFLPFLNRQEERFVEERLAFLEIFKKSEERTLIDPIYENKPDALAMQLERLGKTEGILAIGVFDAEGNLLADFPKKNLPHSLVAFQSDRIEWKRGDLEVEAFVYRSPIEVVGETIGFLEILYSLEEIRGWQKAWWGFFFLLLAALLVTSLVLLNWMMSRLVTTPIKKLVRSFGEIRRERLQLDQGSWRNDEIGRLHESFNEMALRLQNSFDEIEKQNIELKKLDQLKDEFLASISHEIKTPLHAIIGFSEGIMEESKSPDHLRYLKMISESGHALKNLVNRLLDLSQLKAGKLTLQQEGVRISEMLEGILSLSRELIGKKPIQLVSNISNDLPDLWVDVSWLRQVFLNLLENAIKFTETGKITLSAAADSQMIHFVIEDTGIGIPEESFEMIFEEFRQGDGSIRRKYSGSGLGLAIVRKIVQLHGGKVWVESQVGRGSTFHFTVPIAEKS